MSPPVPTPGAGYWSGAPYGQYTPPSAAPQTGGYSPAPPQPYGTPPFGAAPSYGYSAYQPPPYSWQYGTPAHAPARRRRTRDERRQLLIRGLVIALAVVLLAGIGFGIGAWLAPTSPATVAKGLTSKAVAAATQAGTFHYVELSTTNGSRNNIRGDAGPDSGRQYITASGASGTDDFQLRLVHGVVYFRGNRPAVIDQLGVPAAKAFSDAGKWVSVQKGEKPYSAFADGITTKSNISQLSSVFVAKDSATQPNASPPTTQITGGLSDGKTRPAVGSAALNVNSSNSLPQTFAGRAIGAVGAEYQLSWTFSHYGQHVKVTAPSGAIAYSSLKVSSAG